MTFNVYTEDGTHAELIDKFNNIFDALVCFNEQVNLGSEGYIEGIELAVENDTEIESIDFHEF